MEQRQHGILLLNDWTLVSIERQVVVGSLIVIVFSLSVGALWKATTTSYTVDTVESRRFSTFFWPLELEIIHYRVRFQIRFLFNVHSAR